MTINPPDAGVPLPEELQAKWRQVRNNRHTVAALTDALVLRQAQFSEYEAETLDATMKAMNLDSYGQYRVNYVTMTIHRVG